jgi:hypothetical protein
LYDPATVRRQKVRRTVRMTNPIAASYSSLQCRGFGRPGGTPQLLAAPQYVTVSGRPAGVADSRPQASNASDARRAASPGRAG